MTCPICDQKPMNCDCTETERRQFSEIEDLAAEIERLRLTDAEREAVEIAIGLDDSGPMAATLRGLLDRVGPVTTPAPPSTPGECSVPPEWTSRPHWVDPPSGWRYGFPRLYDPQADGNMTEWLISHGYPERLARQGVVCTFTAAQETVEE